MRKEMIQEIRAQLDRFYIDYGSVVRYKGQEEHEEIERAFPALPAVAVEIGRISFEDVGASEKGHQQTDGVPVTIHLFHVLERMEEEDFDETDVFMENVGAVLHSLGAHGDVTTPGLGVLTREEEIPDLSPGDRLVHNQIRFEWQFEDHRPVNARLGQKVDPTIEEKPTY